MTRFKTIGISILLVIINGLFGHYLPLGSCFITPITIGVIAFLYQKAEINVFLIALLIIIVLTSNDILVKLIPQSKYDFESAGVANLLFLISVLISLIVASVILFKDKKGQILKFMLFCISISLASYVYLSYFNFFGLVDYLNTSKSKEIAIRNKVFLDTLKFSTNRIIYKNDTMSIIDGWVEKQIIVNHEHLIKTFDDTSTVNYTIKLKSKINFDSLNISYNINAADVSGSYRIDSTVSFNSLSSLQKLTLYIFKINHNIKIDTVIEKIIIYK